MKSSVIDFSMGTAGCTSSTSSLLSVASSKALASIFMTPGTFAGAVGLPEK
nr:hypothetical protein [Devosia sp.]